MKNKWIRNALSWFLAGAMTLCLAAAAGMPATVWAEEKGGGKYVGDVFIAYGKTEEEAAKWLKDNGWEPTPERLHSLMTIKCRIRTWQPSWVSNVPMRKSKRLPIWLL